jgi:hypothetical protein
MRLVLTFVAMFWVVFAKMKYLLTTMLLFATLLFAASDALAQPVWPELPRANGSVSIPAQEWPLKPGPRTVEISLHYPGGTLDQVDAGTGIMLSLHNWGGTGCGGSASPGTLATELNVVAICVDYLQSGRKASIEDPEPYDFGYLQGLDAVRAVWYVFDGLQQAETPFAQGRIYATGGSGGGNVALMANKLAPRTFTGIIDMCGMPKLSDDIAFNLRGGSGLNARWSRDSTSRYFLSTGAQDLRFVGHPEHLERMRELGCRAKIVVVHGRDDSTCPFEDAREMVANMQAANLDVKPWFIGKNDLDGSVFTSSGHSLGDRTKIVLQVAGDWLKSVEVARKTPTDFERRDEVKYPVSGGEFVIAYQQGYPVARFEPNTQE